MCPDGAAERRARSSASPVGCAADLRRRMHAGRGGPGRGSLRARSGLRLRGRRAPARRRCCPPPGDRTPQRCDRRDATCGRGKQQACHRAIAVVVGERGRRRYPAQARSPSAARRARAHCRGRAVRSTGHRTRRSPPRRAFDWSRMCITAHTWTTPRSSCSPSRPRSGSAGRSNRSSRTKPGISRSCSRTSRGATCRAPTRRSRSSRAPGAAMVGAGGLYRALWERRAEDRETLDQLREAHRRLLDLDPSGPDVARSHRAPERFYERPMRCSR